MEPVRRITAVAAPLPMANVDTDQIIPAAHMQRSRAEGYGPVLFHSRRFREDGTEIGDFVLNRAPYRRAGIIVAGANFGCGSSREAAAYALKDFGIRAVIAPSFGEIHYNNEVRNGLVPAILPEETVAGLWRQLDDSPGAEITIDLEACTVTAPDGTQHAFQIDAFARQCLLSGVDEIGFTLGQVARIAAFETGLEDAMPWLPASAPDVGKPPERA